MAQQSKKGPKANPMPQAPQPTPKELEKDLRYVHNKN